MGTYDKAIKEYNQALRLKPNRADAYAIRGITWGKKGDYDKAIADCNQALKLKPNLDESSRDLAWLQATCPEERYRDGREAVVNAKQANELDGGDDSSYIGTLAAAYAEVGQFDKAVEWQTKAIELTAKDKSATDEDKEELRTRLELYKQGRPYRDERKKP